MASQRYYVVWKGRRTGIFSSWSECERQVKGFVGAEYKGFGTLQEARAAQARRYEEYRGRSSSLGKWTAARTQPKVPSICVDAACAGSPGPLEYRGVETQTGQQIFREGPFADGTNNVGEFLAVVEALRWLKGRGLSWPIYSDSQNAIAWVRAKKCNTRLRRTRANTRLFAMIREAEDELRQAGAAGTRTSLGQPAPVLKWDTAMWGEIPADFGRK